MSGEPGSGEGATASLEKPQSTPDVSPNKTNPIIHEVSEPKPELSLWNQGPGETDDAWIERLERQAAEKRTTEQAQRKEQLEEDQRQLKNAREAIGSITDKPIEDSSEGATEVISPYRLMYHGSKQGAFEQFDVSHQDPFSLFGPGIYLTDNALVASGYSGKNGAIMKVGVLGDRRLLDLGNPETGGVSPGAEVLRATLADALDQQATLPRPGDTPALVASRVSDAERFRRKISARTEPYPREDYLSSKYRRRMADAGTPLPELPDTISYPAMSAERAYAEFNRLAGIGNSIGSIDNQFQLLAHQRVAEMLQKQGYHGFTHEGGVLLGGARHQVVILWDPKDARIVSDPEPTAVSEPAVPVSESTPAPADTSMTPSTSKVPSE